MEKLTYKELFDRPKHKTDETAAAETDGDGTKENGQMDTQDGNSTSQNCFYYYYYLHKDGLKRPFRSYFSIRCIRCLAKKRIHIAF